MPAAPADLIELLLRADWAGLSLAAEVTDFTNHDLRRQMLSRAFPHRAPWQWAGPGARHDAAFEQHADRSADPREEPGEEPGEEQPGEKAGEEQVERAGQGDAAGQGTSERTIRLLVTPDGMFRQETTYHGGDASTAGSDGRFDGRNRRKAVTIAADGQRRWRVYADHVSVGPADPMPPELARLTDPAWLLDWQLTGGAEICRPPRLPGPDQAALSRRWQCGADGGRDRCRARHSAAPDRSAGQQDRPALRAVGCHSPAATRARRIRARHPGRNSGAA